MTIYLMSDPFWIKASRGLQPFAPVTRATLHVHDCYDNYPFRSIHIENGVREYIREVAADRRIKDGKTLRLPPDVEDELFDLVIESTTQLGGDAEVILGRLRIFLIRFGMKGIVFHRPTIRRMR